MRETVLVTGGAGFIGSALIRQLMADENVQVINIDKLTYAGDLESLAEFETNPRYRHEKVDIANTHEIERIFAQFKPTKVMHLAAESHVDRSITGPAVFIETNVMGTYVLLEAARQYWSHGDEELKNRFRFLHISTDEVYGHLGKEGAFSETTPYKPSSPYSASKAASDHLVRAWHHTFGLPTLVTNCSNNFGPWQFPEKLIPVVINNALHGRPIPIYGEGTNVRDWLFVDDHCRALRNVIERGRIGETYVVGGHGERTNLQVARAICSVLDDIAPLSGGKSHDSLITFVKDRPGHDFRYAIDPAKIENELGWKASETFESGLRKTVKWYVEHQPWCNRLLERLKKN